MKPSISYLFICINLLMLGTIFTACSSVQIQSVPVSSDTISKRATITTTPTPQPSATFTASPTSSATNTPEPSNTTMATLTFTPDPNGNIFIPPNSEVIFDSITGLSEKYKLESSITLNNHQTASGHSNYQLIKNSLDDWGRIENSYQEYLISDSCNSGSEIRYIAFSTEPFSTNDGSRLGLENLSLLYPKWIINVQVNEIPESLNALGDKRVLTSYNISNDGCPNPSSLDGKSVSFTRNNVLIHVHARGSSGSVSPNDLENQITYFAKQIDSALIDQIQNGNKQEQPTPLPTIQLENTESAIATIAPAEVFCSDAPKSRLNVGMMAAVAFTDGSANTIRQAAASSDQLGKAPEGTKMLIVDGPVCANGLVWWKVDTDNRLLGWTAEGKNFEYWLEPLNDSDN